MDCQSKLQQIESKTVTDFRNVNCDIPSPTGPVSLYTNLKANNIKVNTKSQFCDSQQYDANMLVRHFGTASEKKHY